MGSRTKGQPSYAKVLAYGTLKRDHTNHSIMQLAGGLLSHNYVVLPNARMVDLGGFPGVIYGYGAAENDQIMGELWNVIDLKVLDHLEGHPNFYKRVKLPVYMSRPGHYYSSISAMERYAAPTKAWVYTLPPHYLSRCKLIPGGSWTRFK